MILTPLFVAHKFNDLDNKKNRIRSGDPIHLNQCKLQDDPWHIGDLDGLFELII